MAKVTYLFGAGASAKVLPVVKQIPEALTSFRTIFINNRSPADENFANHPNTRREMEEDFLTALNLLIENVPKHDSIDTYAKKLRITGQSVAYNQLKAVFSAFMIFKQLSCEVDRRYDSFFASILGTHSQDFIGDINILSWNYDFQLEKAYSAFSKTNDILANQAMLNVNFIGNDNRPRKQEFSINKLNGTAGFLDRSWRNFNPISDSVILDNTLDNESKFFQELIKAYAYYRLQNTSVYSSLIFAWDYENDDFYNKVAEKIKGTEILVIIGYSFPFFNRAIDRKMIHIMSPSIKHIYIQDLVPDNVRDSFTSIWPDGKEVSISLIDSVERFYLPPQL